MMIADLMTGEVDLADVLFLFAVIAAAVSALIFVSAKPPLQHVAHALLAFAVALIAFGFMAL
jgi:hypothetical protein